MSEKKTKKDESKPLNIYQRISAVTDAVKAFDKDGTNEHFGYQFAGIETITQKLNPVLRECGVVLTFTVVDAPEQVQVRQMSRNGWSENQVTQVRVCATATNTDNPEEHVSVVAYGFGVDGQDKGVFKAISGARKYGIFMLFNLHAGQDDPEFDHGTGGKAAPAKSTSAPPKRNSHPSKYPSDKKQAVRKYLLPKLKNWPPKNAAGYEINIPTKGSYYSKSEGRDVSWGEPMPPKQAGGLKGNFSSVGYSNDDDRRDLMRAIYYACDIPDHLRIVSMSDQGFTRGHGVFFNNFLDHTEFPSERRGPAPWEPKQQKMPEPEVPADPETGEIHPDVNLDADMDLEEEEDFFGYD